MMHKRREKSRQLKDQGVSTIVATVMLVLISVVGISIIAAFIIPFVRDPAQKGGDCFNARDHLSLVGDIGNITTCYDSVTKETVLIVKRNPEFIELNGFAVSIAAQGQSKRFDILQGKDNPEATTIYWKGYENPYTIGSEQLLEPGTEFTYYFNTTGIGDVVRAEIAPILKSGDVCPATNTIEIEPC